MVIRLQTDEAPASEGKLEMDVRDKCEPVGASNSSCGCFPFSSGFSSHCIPLSLHILHSYLHFFLVIYSFFLCPSSISVSSWLWLHWSHWAQLLQAEMNPPLHYSKQWDLWWQSRSYWSLTFFLPVMVPFNHSGMEWPILWEMLMKSPSF